MPPPERRSGSSRRAFTTRWPPRPRRRSSARRSGLGSRRWSSPAGSSRTGCCWSGPGSASRRVGCGFWSPAGSLPTMEASPTARRRWLRRRSPPAEPCSGDRAPARAGGPARPDSSAGRDAAAAQHLGGVRAHRPGMRADAAVVLADPRLQLAAVLAAGIAGAPVEPAPVPAQPMAGIGVEVGAEEELLQLRLERGPGLIVGLGAAELAREEDLDWHQVIPVYQSPKLRPKKP